MHIKLADILQGPFNALPLDMLYDEDGTFKVSMANVFGKADQALVQFHNPEVQVEPTVVTCVEDTAVTTGAVVPPWELAAKKAEQLPEPAIEEVVVTDNLQVPWEKTVTTEVEENDRGMPEGWSADAVEKLIEQNDFKFATQQDADDWVIAKNRALPYSTKDESRPDPFNVPDMYKMMEQRRNSHLVGCVVTSFRTACRHAIALSVLYYDQDVERYESALRAERDTLQQDEVEAARMRWKQAVDRRKETIAVLDKEVTDARDAWHSLRDRK